MIGTAVSVSLDGFITGPTEGAGDAGLHDWLTTGDTPSKVKPSFTMSQPSADFFDEGVVGTGAVVAGRRTYDVSGAWGGQGPMAGLPLFVVTHRAPEVIPLGDPPYTFVTDGVETAVEQARAAAGGKNVHLMGRALFSKPSEPDCLRSSSSVLCPWCWVAAFPCYEVSAHATSHSRLCEWSMHRVSPTRPTGSSNSPPAGANDAPQSRPRRELA